MLSAFSLRNLGIILSGPGAELGRRASSFFLTLEGVKAMSRRGSWYARGSGAGGVPGGSLVNTLMKNLFRTLAI